MTCFCVGKVKSEQDVNGDFDFYKTGKRRLRRSLSCFEGKIRQNWGETPQKTRVFRDPPPCILIFCPFSPGLARFLFFPGDGNVVNNITKRRKHLEIDGPDATAKRTIERLTEKVKEAQVSPALKQRWEQNYFSGIEKYADDPERVRAAEEKLSMWYGVVMDDVAPRYSGVMAKARAEYHKRLARKYKRLAEAEEGEEEDLGLAF